MTESMLDKLRDVVLFVAGIVALSSLIMAAYEGFNQRIWSATFLGGFGLACVMVVYLPHLEVLKAFGMEAKLRETYREAVATLESVKRLSKISARASYLSIAWGNRLGTPSAKDKQAVLDDIDAQLTDLKVTAEERAVIVTPWIRMVRADFFSLFSRVIREFAIVKASDLTAKVHATQSQDANDASMAHSALITPWTQKNNGFKPFEQLEIKSLSTVIDEYMPGRGGWLSDKELAAIDVFKQEVVRLNADCEKKGGYTAEAAEYYDRYSGRQAEKAKELWEASRK